MRRLPYCACVLTLLAAPASAAATGPATGGTAAPSYAGGTTYGQPVQKVRRFSRTSSPRPVATEFAVAPATLEEGRPATFTYRIDGRMRTARVRIELTRAGAPAPAKWLRLGYQRTAARHSYVWTPAKGELPAGEYDVTLQAFDDAGHRLRRTARASGRSRVTVRVPPPAVPAVAGVFPILGAYSFGGDDARFGAQRDGHVHQGQDITAAEGTPVVAPVPSFVYWVDVQPGGAGHYVVLRGTDGTDYVFMHLRKGSITAVKGGSLASDQQFAQVGSTGSSTGPHLHFEIWPDGWYSSKESQPIDPLPQLLAWASTR
jgi:murein DD-endopeptidase MepM/ murein hydrolase activator NlpD